MIDFFFSFVLQSLTGSFGRSRSANKYLESSFFFQKLGKILRSGRSEWTDLEILEYKTESTRDYRRLQWEKIKLRPGLTDRSEIIFTFA